MSLRALVQDAADRLEAAGLAYGHGTTNALDEAAWLVLWQLGLPLETALDDPHAALPNAQQVAQCQALIAQRISTRKPAAYLTRQAWLQGFSFYVDERVIVPRSLIAELLVNGGIDYFLHTGTHKVLDLCTGNASLAIIAAQVYPDTSVWASDVSQDALDVAAINVAQHDVNARVHLLGSDGLSSPVLVASGPFDLILCNPPYVNAQSMAALPPEFQAEPALALDGNTDGGHDGMDFVRRLLRDLPGHLNPQGVLVLEIGHERAFFEAAFPALPAVWLQTSAGEDQVLLLTREHLTP
ncbi:MAG: 50S ribosomal protein L3 N(5)-glutamine methyltransferase [Betaproteobacteria bacterium]|jgi:ribosomal protein L3 glutamine methyltransferase